MKILIGLVSENYHHPPVLMGKLIASEIESSIDVLIVVPENGHLENAEAVQDQVREDFNGFPVEIYIRQGKSADVYQDFLAGEDYNLVIMDPNRGTGFRQRPKINQAIKDSDDLSILLSEFPKPRLEKILLATACKQDDYSLVTEGAKLARALDAELTMLHVISGNVPTMYTGLDQLEETVEELLQTDTPFAKHLRRGISVLNEFGVDSDVMIRRGVPLEEIVRETQINNYDLVVIGATKVSEDIRGRLLGNLTTRLINELKLPVLIIDKCLFEKE